MIYYYNFKLLFTLLFISKSYIFILFNLSLSKAHKGNRFLDYGN